MPKDPEYKFEFVTSEARLRILDDRLRAYEQELVNTQINLAVDQAAYPDSESNAPVLVAHQNSLNMTLARIEAVKKLRDAARAEATT